MKVGEICNRSVVIINRDESALEAAKLMRKYNVGDVVIVEESGGKKIPLAIVTDRDLTIEIIAQEVDPDSIMVGDLFIRPRLITVSVDEDSEALLDKMKRYSIRRVPVVEQDGSLAGIITLDDIMDTLAEDFAEIASLIDKQSAA